MIFGVMQRSGEQRYAKEMIALSKGDAITQYIPADKKGHWCDDRATLVQHMIWNTKESLADPCPTVASDVGLVMTAWARIDNRDELGTKLGLNANDSSLSDAFFIMKSYQKWGEDCVLHLIGDFAFVIYDQREQKMFCARDQMGARPFYYYISDKYFIFASGLNVFVELPDFELKKSQKWMAEYMLGLSMSFVDTAYVNIKKLPPAHCLTITADKHNLRQYFRFSAETSLSLKDSREYVECYREHLEEAIRCRLRSNYKIGSELTGGIDSSTVTSYASKLIHHSDTNLHTFSFIGYENEAEYIDEVCRSSGIRFNYQFSHHNQTSCEKHQEMSHAIGVLGCPVEYSMSIAHEPFYVKAEELHIRTMLSGFGGDEFVTSPANVALTEWLVQRRYLHLYKNLEGAPIRRISRLAKRVLKNLLKRNVKYNSFYYNSISQRWPFQIVKQEFVNQFDLQSLFLGVAKFDAGYTRLNDFILGNRHAPFIHTRMESCNLLAAARKIEYRWPLLDIRLIKLFLAIPTEQKYAKGMGRLLHRRAISDLLPEKIAWKEKKSMGAYISSRSPLKVPEISFGELAPEISGMIDLEKLLMQMKCQVPHADTELSAVAVQRYRNTQSLLWLDQWAKRT